MKNEDDPKIKNALKHEHDNSKKDNPNKSDNSIV